MSAEDVVPVLNCAAVGDVVPAAPSGVAVTISAVIDVDTTGEDSTAGDACCSNDRDVEVESPSSRTVLDRCASTFTDC